MPFPWGKPQLIHADTIFFLSASVWSLGHDRYAFQRLTGKNGICITTFDGMERRSSPAREDWTTEVHSFDLQRPQSSSFTLLKSRWSAVLRAVRRWQIAFNSVQQTPCFKLEKSRIFSCRVLYHLTLLHLFAELSELHSLATLESLPSEESPLLSNIRRWLDCEDCNSAVLQAISLVEATQEELQVEPSQRASFNLLAFSECCTASESC